jgi:hypothetical protein
VSLDAPTGGLQMVFERQKKQRNNTENTGGTSDSFASIFF